MLQSGSHKSPERSQSCSIVEVLNFRDEKSPETDDLPKSGCQNDARFPMLHIDQQSRADQAVVPAKVFDLRSAFDLFHRSEIAVADVFLSLNRHGFPFGATGIRSVDDVFYVFIQHAFDASGVPCLLRGFQYRSDDLDIDGKKISANS